MSDDHHILFAVTKNNSQNPTNWKKRSIGATGEYGMQISFNRLGECKSATFTVRCSSPVKRDLIGAFVRIEPKG